MLVLSGAVAVHHSPVSGEAHDGSQVAAAAELCLAVFTAVSAAVLAVAVGLIALRRRRPTGLHAARSVLSSIRPPEPWPRAGPALLVLFCVSRR